jgi:orotate phosphoribosyltransferase
MSIPIAPGQLLREHKQDAIRQRSWQDLDQSGILMSNGHFDYGHGYHGASYLAVPRLLERPSLVWRLGENLLDLIPSALIAKTQVVSGLGTSGILFAHAIAAFIDARRPLTAPPCRFAPLEADHLGSPILPAAYAGSVHHRGVLIVDVWSDPVGVLAACADVLRTAGADVVAAAVVWGRTGMMGDPEVPVITLCEWTAGDGVPACECLQCRGRDGLAVTGASLREVIAASGEVRS